MRANGLIAMCLCASLTEGCVTEVCEGACPYANGWQWCIEAIGANGTRTASGADVQIKKAGDWVTACVTMCEGDHQIMGLGLDGEIPAGHVLEPLWEDLKTDVRDNTEGFCQDRVAELASMGGPINFTAMNDITCQTAVDILEPYEGYAVFTEDCAISGTGSDGGPPSEVGPARYGLTSYNQVRSCTTNTSAKTITCSVDKDFIAVISEDVSLIYSDSAQLVPAAAPAGLLFSTCASNSLLYAVGFRVNDRLISIDNYPTATLEDAISLFGHLGQSSYTGSSAVAKFRRGTNLWTFTLNRTNFTTYP